MSRTIKKEITCPACGEKVDRLPDEAALRCLNPWTRSCGNPCWMKACSHGHAPSAAMRRCSVTLVYITIWPINL